MTNYIYSGVWFKISFPINTYIYTDFNTNFFLFRRSTTRRSLKLRRIIKLLEKPSTLEPTEGSVLGRTFVAESVQNWAILYRVVSPELFFLSLFSSKESCFYQKFFKRNTKNCNRCDEFTRKILHCVFALVLENASKLSVAFSMTKIVLANGPLSRRRT